MSDDNNAISLEGSDAPISGESAVRHTGAAARAGGLGLGKTAAKFKRSPSVTGQGAIRCKIFHCRIAAGAISFMENQINEWLDSENVEVKQTTQVIGVLEGKVAEPNLFVTVWY
jgi:hypothetical protein